MSESSPIILVDSDPLFAAEIRDQLALFGYALTHAPHMSDLQHLLPTLQPAALLIDMQSLDDGSELDDTLSRLISGPPERPIIFVSIDTDLPTRLRALRAGGKAYFHKPIDVGALVDTLDQLTGWRVAVPYRVLIVDDAPLVARHAAGILRQAEMEVAIMHTPMDALSAIEAFQPDLILMDIYMPGCTGRELAAVIRQQPAYINLPIVFLSGEQDRMAQLAAVSQGGDDFLTKPVQAEMLITAVVGRIERAHTIRAHLVRDGLTGLLNHSAIMAQLESMLARAERLQSTCAVAILDLDHFKQVNDTHGHLIGDRVLRSLARLLQQSLRRSDCIGRYGGEEFVIIFPDTESAGARVALETIRARWEQVVHQAGSLTFRVTLSAGAAHYPANGRGISLLGAADQALYQAKRAGRNRVV